MLPSSLEVVPNLALNYLPSQSWQVWHARSTPRFNQSANKRNRKQPVWTDHLSLYISTVSPYNLKKRRSHQNYSEWQNESYGKCQFLQKLGSRLISHFSFGKKKSKFLFIPSKNLRYSIQGSIQISKTTASRSSCERSIPDSYYRQHHRNTARKISFRYGLQSYYQQHHQRPAGCNTGSRVHLKQQKCKTF